MLRGEKKKKIHLTEIEEQIKQWIKTELKRYLVDLRNKIDLEFIYFFLSSSFVLWVSVRVFLVFVLHRNSLFVVVAVSRWMCMYVPIAVDYVHHIVTFCLSSKIFISVFVCFVFISTSFWRRERKSTEKFD